MFSLNGVTTILEHRAGNAPVYLAYNLVRLSIPTTASSVPHTGNNGWSAALDVLVQGAGRANARPLQRSVEVEVIILEAHFPSFAGFCAQTQPCSCPHAQVASPLSDSAA